MLIRLDLETTIRNVGDDAVGDMKASPYHPDNKIAYLAYAFDDDEPVVRKLSDDYDDNLATVTAFLNILVSLSKTCPNGTLIIQNSSFDLAYLLEYARKISPSYHMEVVKALMSFKLWDTMIVEYLLSGQTKMWASLDYLSEKYGGVLKDDRMKEYWKAGIDTFDIPEEEIIPYAKNDVANLLPIYYAQSAGASALDMEALIESQMLARMSTILMEHNGMFFDKTLAEERAKTLRVTLDNCEEVLQHCFTECVSVVAPVKPEPSDFNVGSVKQVKAFLFGGEIKLNRVEPKLDADGVVEVFKSGIKKGLPKSVNKTYAFEFPGLFPDPSIEKVDVDTLKAVKKAAGDDAAVGKFVELLLEYRELKKQISTYFDGYRALTWPDGLIHGSLNHCSTATGRLSSSNPNLQNISNKESGD